MPTFLRNYLLVTGALAFVSASMPFLIIIGFIAGVAPGFVLAIAPTAFIYGVLFAIGWVIAFPRFGRIGAIGLGAAFAAAGAVGAPALINSEVAGTIAELRGEDRAPPAPAMVSGAVRVERHDGTLEPYRMGEPRPYRCDDLCAAALFTPGVTSVTLAPATAAEPARTRQREVAETTFRLTPRLAGGTACEAPIVPAEGGGQLMPWPDLATLRVAWKLALSAGDCIRRAALDETSPAPDWTLRFERGERSEAPRHGGLAPRLRFKRVTLADKGGVVLRRTQVDANVLSGLLFVELAGGKENMHLDWARRRFAEGEFEPIDVLGAATTLGVSTASSVAGRGEVGRVRDALGVALDDPALPAGAPAFSLTRTYFDGFSRFGKRPDVQPGDAALVGRLVADARVRELFGLHHAIVALGPDAAALRGPMAARLLATRYPEDREIARIIGHSFTAFPAGLFATQTPDEARLLAGDDRRRWAAGLVLRQADRGGEAAGDLVRIIAEAYARPIPKKSYDDPDRLDDAGAAVHALCLVGPAAAPWLARIEAMIESGAVPGRVLESEDWRMMLARLGKPAESFVKPSSLSGTQEAFVERIRQKLARFRPDRCR